MRNYTDVPLARDAHTIHMQQELSPKQQRFCSGYPYAENMGALMYLCVLTRPDIAYAEGTLTRHMANPTYAACKACSRVLNYLHTFPGLGIRFQAGTLQLHAYTDSDWAACLRTRRSVSGNVVFMAGGPVTWVSKLQPIVATSSMEAEYISAYFVVQEVTWLRDTLHELNPLGSEPTLVFIDNTSARTLAQNPVFHARSKHINVKFNWLREKVCEGAIRLEYVASADQTADIMTKLLTGEAFHRHQMVLVCDSSR